MPEGLHVTLQTCPILANGIGSPAASNTQIIKKTSSMPGTYVQVLLKVKNERQLVSKGLPCPMDDQNERDQLSLRRVYVVCARRGAKLVFTGFVLVAPSARPGPSFM